MPVTMIPHKNEAVLIVELKGHIAAKELSDAMGQVVLPYVRSRAPQMIHVIYDTREIDMEFKEFVGYLSLAARRREEEGRPENLSQHFVGTSHWIASFRNWIGKRFGEQMSMFTSFDEALQYIEASAAASN